MYNKTAADKRMEDEERFAGHLTSYIVILTMLALFGLTRSVSLSTIVAVAVVWGALVALHGRAVFRHPQDA